MSASVLATVRPPYGSRWAATARPFARAASATCGRRWSSSDPRPHQEVITVPTPVAAISRICASTTSVSADEYGPRAG